MKGFITHLTLEHIKKFLWFILFSNVISVGYAAKFKLPSLAELKTPKGEIIKVRILTTQQETTQGVSGLKPNQMSDDNGALFLFKQKGLRTFWMPNTFFDLDIFFLDKNLKVIDVERNVAHFPSYTPTHQIPRVRPVTSWHVLEMKASSKISKSIAKGAQLIWISPVRLEQIISNIRP